MLRVENLELRVMICFPVYRTFLFIGQIITLNSQFSTLNSTNSQLVYLVNENFMLNPKSCVVVGYELDESSGVLVCRS